jgi:hypothetical protein
VTTRQSGAHVTPLEMRLRTAFSAFCRRQVPVAWTVSHFCQKLLLFNTKFVSARRLPLQRRGRVRRRPAFGAVGQRGGSAHRQAQVRRTPPPAQPRQVRVSHVPQLGRRGRSGIHLERCHLPPAAGQFGVGC